MSHQTKTFYDTVSNDTINQINDKDFLDGKSSIRSSYMITFHKLYTLTNLEFRIYLIHGES